MVSNLILFDSYIITDAIKYSIIVLVTTIIICVTIGLMQHHYFKKHKMINDESNSVKTKKRAIKILYIAALAVTGYALGSTITTVVSYTTALSHGLSVNKETGKYDLTLSEILYLNKNSIKETNVDIDTLNNSVIIYVRYDCPDCVALHNQLLELESENVIFLSSRSETGKSVREKYDIDLTEVPQGVYINDDGKAITISIMRNENNNPVIDYQQINNLLDMRNKSETN